MSWAAMDWVCEQNIKDPQAKFVLLMIAKHVDDKWQAFPSSGRLATLTGLGERTVRRKIADLKRSGIIFVESRNVGGRQSSNLITINRKGGQADQRGWSEQPPNKSNNNINSSNVIRGSERPPKTDEVDFLSMASKAMKGTVRKNGN